LTGAAYFTFLGLVGALLYVFIWSRSFDELKRYENVRHVVVGALAGFVYSVLHSEYSFPNAVMAMVVGYFGPDLVQAVMERARVAPRRRAA